MVFLLMTIFLWILLIIISLILQTTLLVPLGFLYGARINLVLLLTIFAGLYGGGIKGAATGFLGGIIGDSLSGSLLGMGALSKTIVGSFSGSLKTKFYHKDIFVQLTVSFLGILIHELIYLCLIFFYRGASPFPSAVVKTIAFTVVINTLLAPFFFGGIRKILKTREARHIGTKAQS